MIKSWWIFLGFIPSAYSVFQSYFPTFLPTFVFPEWSIYIIFLASFLLSGFIVWRKENNKAERFKKKLEANVNYKIIQKIKKVESIDIKKIEHRIKNLEKNAINDHLSSIVMSALDPTFASTDDLKGYLSEAKKFNTNAKGIYNLLLTIQNIGTKFDEHINIKIIPSKETVVLVKEELQAVTNIPEDPTQYKNRLGYLGEMVIPRNSNPQGFHREIVSFKKDYIEVELNHLRASEDVSIILDGIYINGPSFTFYIEITSRHLKQPLKLTISNKIHK